MSETTRQQSDLEDSLGRLQDRIEAELEALREPAARDLASAPTPRQPERLWLAVSARAPGVMESGETAEDALARVGAGEN